MVDRLAMEITSIGKIGKAIGLHGQIKILLDVFEPEAIQEAEVVFVKTPQGHWAPYFVEFWNIDGRGLLLQLEGINDRETARLLTGAELGLRAEDLPEASPQEDHSYPFVGFQIVDQQAGPIGAIQAIIELPQQFLAEVNYQGKEILIPLHEELIVAVNEQQQLLQMDLPEGLLEL